MKEQLWTSEEAIRATGGKSQESWRAYDVSIDSRTIKEGDLFIALKGENFDGHDFVGEVAKKGAAAAVVSRVPKGDVVCPLLIVKDTHKALIDLGIYSRKRVKAIVIGVTGSVGKTSVKDGIALVLSLNGKIHKSEGNLNNHIGVPLTLSRMPIDTLYAVIEMGMNHAGEISELTDWVRPDIAIINEVQPAHLEFFDSIEKIAEAKAEIFEGVKPEGFIIINKDNSQFEKLKKTAEKLDIKHIISFGSSKYADFKLDKVELREDGQEVFVNCFGIKFSYKLKGIGMHHVINSLGVLAVAFAAGVGDIRKSAKMLEQFELPKGRGKILTLSVNATPFTLLDDSYNASPASMKAAFEVLGKLKKIHKKRAIAVLGNMLELGDKAGALHASLVEDLESNDVDLVFTAGELMKHLYDKLPKSMQGAHAIDQVSLQPELLKNIRKGDVILVKGSHGSGMWKFSQALQEKSNLTEG